MRNTEHNKDFMERLMAIDINNYLKINGYQRIDTQGKTAYYNSPFGPDKGNGARGDFSVGSHYNSWHCMATGRGGNILELDGLLKGHSYHQSFNALKDLVPATLITEEHLFSKKAMELSMVRVLSISPKIRDEKLLNYLKDQQLPISMASRFFDEYTIMTSNILQTGLGVELASGNPLVHVPYQGSYHHDNSYKFFNNGSDIVSVYVGASDMLHGMKIRQAAGRENVILMGNVQSFEKARDVMESHHHVNLFFPKGTISDQYIAYAQWVSPIYQDMRKLIGDNETLTQSRQQKIGLHLNKTKIQQKGRKL